MQRSSSTFVEEGFERFGDYVGEGDAQITKVPGTLDDRLIIIARHV